MAGLVVQSSCQHGPHIIPNGKGQRLSWQIINFFFKKILNCRKILDECSSVRTNYHEAIYHFLDR